MAYDIAPLTTVRRHPIRGLFFGTLLGAGIALYLIVFAVVAFGNWPLLAGPVGLGAATGGLWGRFGRVKPLKGRIPASLRRASERGTRPDTSPSSAPHEPAMSDEMRAALAEARQDNSTAAGVGPRAPGAPRTRHLDIDADEALAHAMEELRNEPGDNLGPDVTTVAFAESGLDAVAAAALEQSRFAIAETPPAPEPQTDREVEHLPVPPLVIMDDAKIAAAEPHIAPEPHLLTLAAMAANPQPVADTRQIIADAAEAAVAAALAHNPHADPVAVVADAAAAAVAVGLAANPYADPDTVVAEASGAAVIATRAARSTQTHAERTSLSAIDVRSFETATTSSTDTVVAPLVAGADLPIRPVRPPVDDTPARLLESATDLDDMVQPLAQAPRFESAAASALTKIDETDASFDDEAAEAARLDAQLTAALERATAHMNCS